MRRISLRIKYMLLILTFALLVPLFFLGFSANHERYKDILYITPNANRNLDVSIVDIEKINEEDFLTTYQVEQEKKIKAIHGNHTVNLRGTNYSYPFVLNYNLVNGGFFTKSAQEQGSKVVVLNEIAAFELFGGNDCIRNEIIVDNLIYTVVGVLNDKDAENKNIYIPITLLNQSPNEFISISNTDISEQFIKAQYKELGITTDYYDFINLNSLSQMIKEKAVVSCILILIMILILIIKLTLYKIVYQYKTLNKLLRKAYLKDLLKKEIKSLGFLIGNFAFSAILIFFIGILGSYIFEVFLKWGDLLTFTMKHINGSFMNNFNSIEMALLYSNIFFVLFLILFSIIAYSFGLDRY